jgi:hypothetical protein
MTMLELVLYIAIGTVFVTISMKKTRKNISDMIQNEDMETLNKMKNNKVFIKVCRNNRVDLANIDIKRFAEIKEPYLTAIKRSLIRSTVIFIVLVIVAQIIGRMIGLSFL